jgi:hypothetical protein
MIRITPLRRITLHFSQILLTLALTFIASLLRAAALVDEADDHASARIEAGPKDQHTLPRPWLHTKPTGFLGRPGNDAGSVRRLEAKQALGQLSGDRGLDGLLVSMCQCNPAHLGSEGAQVCQESAATSSAA